VHPDTGVLYVPSVTLPAILRVRKSAPEASDYTYIGSYDMRPVGTQGLPLVKPPYGRITAINL
jgi:quinoprotein glucose dehydrogenase